MKNIIGIAFGVFLLAGPATSQAQAPSDISDLVGARGSSFDPEMERRGYEFVKTVGASAFWWSGNSRTCVSAAIDNGRIASIQTTTAGDCGHSADSRSSSASSSDGEAAAIVVGVAAVGLIAAMSQHHKKNGHNNSKHNDEYERGYNDAIYGSPYTNDDSEAYHSGYMAGEAERSNRRHANSALVRGAPASAQNACKRRADAYWDVPDGSSVPVNVFDYGQGNYEVTVASGHRRGSCSVNAAGHVSGFEPE